MPHEWMKYILPKGFIAVDGCSLTVRLSHLDLNVDGLSPNATNVVALLDIANRSFLFNLDIV